MTSAGTTSRDRDLLLAATVPDGRAAAAWERWRSTGDLASAGGAGGRLLPLVWHNRAAARIGDEDLPKLKEQYVGSFGAVSRTLRGGLAAIDLLAHAGIPTLLLKGAAIITRFPGNIGVRPMGDVDILVPRRDARQAMALLAQDGWTPAYRWMEQPLGAWHAVDLKRGMFENVDLHWSATVVPGDDGAIWRDSVPTLLAGQEVRVPSLAAQLLITSVHGVGPSPAPLRWIADALVILRDEPQIDWPELVAEAQRRGVVLATLRALEVLSSEFAAPVPAGVLSDLRASPRPWPERLASRSAARSGRGADYATEFHRYRRLCDIGDPDRARTFVGHCAQRWGFRSSQQLARAGLLRARQLAQTGRADTWEQIAHRAYLAPD